MAAQNRLANIAKHLMIEDAALGAPDQNGCTFIGDRTAPVFKALETHAIKYGLKVSDLLG